MIEFGLGFGQPFFGFGQVGYFGPFGFKLGALLGDVTATGGQPFPALVQVLDFVLKPGPAGFVIGRLFGQCRQFLFQLGGGGIGGGKILGGLGACVILALGRRFDAAHFVGQAPEGGVGIGDEGGFPCLVGGGLFDPVPAIGALFPDPLFISLQVVAGEVETLKLGRRLGLALAPFRQLGGMFDLDRRGGAGGAGQGRDHGLRFRKFLLGRLQGFLVGGPAQEKQRRLGLADVVRNIAVAGCLADLLLQVCQLRIQGHQDVVQALEIGFRAPEPQFGLVAARVQAGNAGRFLQQQPSLDRFGGDHGADPALTDNGRGTGPGGGIGKQKLHVPGPDLAAVDPVGGPLFPFDAAADLQFIEVIELRRGDAGGVVEAEDHFSDIAGRAVLGAAEDDVIHFAAAHLLGRGFPHHPAQSFDQIGFAAPVGTDNPRQAQFDLQVGAFDEGFEARKPELVKSQQGSFVPSFPTVPGPRLRDAMGGYLLSALSKTFLKFSYDMAPEIVSLPMMNVGVELTLYVSWAAAAVRRIPFSNSWSLRHSSTSVSDMPPNRATRTSSARGWRLRDHWFWLRKMISMKPKNLSRPAQRAIIDAANAGVPKGKSR